MLIIPLSATPSQTAQVQLSGQNVTLNIYQRSYGLFMDVLLNNAVIVQGVICENLNLIVRSAYLGFIGDFCWIDNQATSPGAGSDPVYTGIGGQFSLAYLAPGDIPSDLGIGVS